MTDKEQIIIDGCNVSECVHYEDLSCTAFRDSCGYPLDCKDFFFCNYKQLARKTQECEEYKKRAVYFKDVNKQLGYKYLTIKQECEELKKEIINKNEKIKELRFSVSDLTNRLCYLNAEKSFRIVDLEQTLDEIEKELKEDIYCENQECGCDDFEECLKYTKEHILDIIQKVKQVKN